jgi:hypothetical protein
MVVDAGEMETLTVVTLTVAVAVFVQPLTVPVTV